ncbi:TonB-dependent receptor [Phenylobacterium hankyongense]|uniref:TonB-dependent receptor n=1 Tax=Phenylobacterium hankyongense TaxID=1813876 RepID=UPI001401F3D5|nr:TonB-dependent receptor [Phenylobacterium hankyongense]
MTANAAAAQAAPPPSAPPPPGETTVETLIVTGTSAARTALTTPMQATSIGSDRLERLQANSAADILTTIPMLKAEGGGGEVAANVFVAGLPSGGQYQFTPLEFNGIPVIGSIGLNSSAPDVYYRSDLGVERLEFVHGGVSNLFGGGSVGGLINYIDRTGTAETHGQAKLELGELGRIRTDFAANGPLNADAGLYYAFSGFYRYDEGPLKSGMPTDGYQVRGNIKKEFDGGYVTIFGQYIDDKVQFFADYPLTGDTHKRPTGNDGKTIYTTMTSALEGISYLTPDGVYRTKVGDGAASKGGQVGIEFKKDFGDGWGVNGRGNVGSYKTSFALFAGGDNVQNLPTTQAGFLQAYGYNPAANTAVFTYANSGQPVPAGNLLWADRVIDRIRPLNTASGELNLTKEIQAGGWDHHLTLGAFAARTEASDINYGYAFLGDFANAPQLINATVTNTATGVQTIVSRNGLLRAGLQYTNNWAEAKRYAVYGADQVSVGKWELDVGGRVETLDGRVRREGSRAFVTDTTPGLSPLLSTVQWGNGQFLDGSVSTTAWALAASALYRVSDNLSVFVNASRGYFMPQLNTVQISAAGVQTYRPEIIKQVEGGFKYASGPISGSMSAFYSTLTDRQNVQLLNNPAGGGLLELVNQVATRSYGVEGDVRLRIVEGLTFEGNVTYEHDRYTRYTPIAACTNCVGNTLVRQPDWMANAGFYYNKDGIDAALFDTYTGRTFTSDLNNIELPAFHVVRLDLGYTLTVRGGDKLRAGLSVYNLFDSQAVTEGSPRLGTLQNAGQAFFVGRTVLPRRVTVQLSYKF